MGKDKLADFKIAISKLESNPTIANVREAHDASRKAMPYLLEDYLVFGEIPEDKFERFNDLSLRCEQAIMVVEELDPYAIEYESENGQRYTHALAESVAERVTRIDVLNTLGTKAFLNYGITNSQSLGQNSESTGAA